MKTSARVLGALVVLMAVLTATNGFSQTQYYVLDGFGGVHAGGGAAAIVPATPYFGFDVAVDIAFVAHGTTVSVGDGILVLDGFGGVHSGGALASEVPTPATPYFGFDIARAIVSRNVPPRINGALTNIGNTEVTSATYVSIVSTTITAPDDGFVFVVCNMSMGNNSTADKATARLGIGLDGLTNNGAFGHTVQMAAAPTPSHSSQSVSRVLGVVAGAHTLHCLVNKETNGGTGQVLYSDPSIVAIYVDRGPMGASAPGPAVPSGPTGSIR